MARQASKPLLPPVGLWTALTANALVLAVFLYAWLLEDYDFDLYRAAVQEDEYLEWGTFWAFFAACGIFAWAAVRERKTQGGLPWFVAGLSVFCFLFAMEEISWAQRIFAYRPPTYFLENNFQQEPNFHNVISTDLRKMTLKAIIGGFGVALPLLGLLATPTLAKRIRRLGLLIPPPAFIPAFVAAYYTYSSYPWEYAGEVVELMLGLTFLFVGLVALHRATGDTSPLSGRTLLALPAAAVVVMLLGLGTAAAVRSQQSLWPENIKAAETEMEALKADILAMSDLARQRFPTRCGVHKRVYSFVEKYRKGGLRDGRYGALQAQGLPEERAEFFIDPWNAPYWIRDRCRESSGKRTIFIYSFGPNRRRDSSRWEILGDDIGEYVYVNPGRDGETTSDLEPEEDDS